MKKTVVFLLALAAFISSVAFAAKIPIVPENIEQSFKKEFPEVAQFNWEKKDDLYIAEFRENEITHFAYFDSDANLLGVIRYITTADMPFRTLFLLKKKYGNFGKLNALEVSMTGGETYYFTCIFHKNKFKTIKVYPDGGTEIIKKQSLETHL